MRRLLVTILLFLGAFELACGGSSPTEPSNTSTPAIVPPATLAAGFQQISHTIPGEALPVMIYVTRAEPGKDGVLTIGQPATITNEMRGPGGYEAQMGITFIPIGSSYDRCDATGSGSNWFLSPKGGSEVGTSIFTPDATRNNVDRIVYKLWVGKRGSGLMNRIGKDCPDLVVEEHLGWHM